MMCGTSGRATGCSTSRREFNDENFDMIIIYAGHMDAYHGLDVFGLLRKDFYRRGSFSVKLKINYKKIFFVINSNVFFL